LLNSKDEAATVMMWPPSFLRMVWPCPAPTSFTALLTVKAPEYVPAGMCTVPPVAAALIALCRLKLVDATVVVRLVVVVAAGAVVVVGRAVVVVEEVVAGDPRVVVVVDGVVVARVVVVVDGEAVVTVVAG
jgi:hypothetical protein